METIINFLEQYWGYTLFGGVSLGAIVTFTITQIKVILKDKLKSKELGEAIETIENLYTELDRRTNESNDIVKQLNDDKRKMNEELVAKNEYFEKVQAATFQAISYLVIASKLPTEDKIALQSKFSDLVKNKTVEYTNVLKEDLVEAVKDNIIPDAVDTVKQSVEETKSLLDKYTKE